MLVRPTLQELQCLATDLLTSHNFIAITGASIFIKGVKNVIVRNLKLSKVKGGDCIGIQEATNIWLDHLDISGDLDASKDYYDGLLDITHAGDYITVSNSHFHDHVSLQFPSIEIVPSG